MPSLDVKSVTKLVANTRFAANIQHLPVCDSTNTVAAKAASHTDPAPNGSVFVADEQTAGRGRGGHSWHSAAGDGLYCSAVIRPRIPLSEALWISLATGLAAQRAIHKTSAIHADIRWPNDLLIGTKKCGGILVETASQSGKEAQIRYAVIGIGINVHHAAFPPELATPATSLRIEGSADTTRETLLANLLIALDSEITLLETELHGTLSGSPLLDRFTAASSWVSGKRVRVEEAGGYTGITAGLNSQGFLLVHGDDGLPHTVLSGGVRPA